MGGGQSVAAKGPLEPCIYISTVIASELLFDSMLYSAGVLLQTIPILVSSRLRFQVLRVRTSRHSDPRLLQLLHAQYSPFRKAPFQTSLPQPGQLSRHGDLRLWASTLYQFIRPT
jgi:hypothetical protein